MGYRRSIFLRLALGCAALGVFALLALFAYFPRVRENKAERILSPSGSSAVRATPLRSLPFESLPELTFDEALTILGSEVERRSRDPEAWSRIERVAARLEELHGENLEKIEKSARYYESRGPEVRARFAAFRAEYRRRYETLRDHLAALEDGDVEAGAGILDLLRESDALQPPRELPEAKDLPRRRLPAEHREPRTTSEDWNAVRKVGSAHYEVESGAWERLFGNRAAHAQETEDDLGETSEVKFRPESGPEIQKLLDDEGLRGSPAKIANWVRNHIEFVPIWGALQSSTTCLENRRGTAMDIASLTIALLRASGIHARYQSGTVRMPIAQAMNWLGNFESPVAASSLLSSGGIASAVQVDENGQPQALRFEHVWVRAFVDYLPYQGACHIEGDTWVDVDACTKAYDYFPRPDVSPFDRVGDPRAFLGALTATADLDPVTGEVSKVDYLLLDRTLEFERAGLVEHVRETAGGLTIGEMLGRGRIRERHSTVLGGSPPFEVLARGWERSELLDADRFGVAIRIEHGGKAILSFQARAADVGSSRFSIFFRPENAVDARIIADQIPAERDSPPFRSLWIAGVRVVPQLVRDGAPVLEGAAVDMGAAVDIIVDFEEPVLSTAPIRAHIAAGEETAIGIDFLSVPPSLFGRLQAEHADLSDRFIHGSFEGLRGESMLEVILSGVIHGWFREADSFNRTSGNGLGCVTHRYPSAGICSAKWLSGTVFGLPLEANHRGITVDIPGDVNLLMSRDGNQKRCVFAGLLQGFYGSGLESQVPALFTTTDVEPSHWFGTSDALAIAGRLGDTQVLIDAGNAGQVLPNIRLAAADREEIREAVDRGFVVFTHENQLASAEGRHAGYAILDPETASGIFRVSGGTNGGDPVRCLRDSGASQSTIDRFARLWGGLFRASVAQEVYVQVGLDLAGPLIPLAPAVKFLNAISNVLKRYTENADRLDTAFAAIGDRAEPLVGLVVLMTALEVVNQLLFAVVSPLSLIPGGTEIVGAYLNVVQGTAWRGVRNVLLYQARIESELGEIGIPVECLESLGTPD